MFARSYSVVGMGTAVAAAALFAMPCLGAAPAGASKEQLRRGEYLVNFGGCHDCHSPKIMSANGPVPDKTRLLSGYPAKGPVPAVPAGALGPDKWAAMTNGDLTAWVGPWGTSFSANITPDNATGIGGWTADQFIKTMRTGRHLGVGRPILPPMPWTSLAGLTDPDLKAMFAYLRSVKAIENPVPQPIPPK